ncbi:helix-turn-helix protein [Actinomadura pelletieri DSM 43383]|uniref:Helix-turn-helix protein n=1 Tax=Actinomadura pelletieri DSM 43383 TaxID=1120940 RepID=A0A495QSL5_9ACTN|nr:helix-turn-helix transcriptional regulator [Actinomadura pelletieri]RKS76391.1 helix-turn-helix protein [Actinomadura pelletieri DSM 43383]
MSPKQPTYIPSVRARRLARWLSDFRLQAGLSQDSVTARLGWSQSKLSHIERGRNKAAPADVALLLDLYGVVTPEREAVIDLAEKADQRGWWTAYADVFSSPYVALEDEAAFIGEWAPQIVPGLLQTPDYTRAIMRAGNLEQTSGKEIERRVRARMARQTILTRSEGAPRLHVILDESAIYKRIGGPETMREQLRRLVSDTNRPNVTIQVLSTSVGEHPGLDGSFIVLEFEEEEDPNVACVEGLHGVVYLEDQRLVTRCSVAFRRLHELALNPQESVALIRATAEQ